MGRYDQIEGVAYGKCLDCGISLQTDEEAQEHRTQTMILGRSSHRTSGTNPTRADRISSMVTSTVKDAIWEAINKLRNEVDDGLVSAAEITEALRWHSDFLDEWERS